MTVADVVVVGGGAAGLTAALVLGRARRRVVVVDARHPRNAPAAHMQGFPSRDGMPPADFLATVRDEIVGYGVELVDGRVERLEPGFTVRLAGGRVRQARRVLLATGVPDELPEEIDGVRARWGRDLLHCPYCHGWEVRDLALGVLGTVEGSVDHAHLVRQWSADLVYFTHTTEPTAQDEAALAARGVRIVRGPVARLVVDGDRLVGVGLADGRIVPRDAVFVRPVNRPRADGLLAGLGAAIDAGGFPVVDPRGRTSVPGLWVAGNLVDPRASVVTSAGAGAAAAMAVNAELVRDDVDAAQAGAGPRPASPWWSGPASIR